MRTILKISTLLSLIAISYNGLQAQKNNLEHIVPHKIFETDKFQSLKESSSKSFVIGPTLYDQMGELSNNYCLSIEYLNSNFDNYTGFSADDFIVPIGEIWEIKYLKNTIYTPHSTDNIKSFNVIIYSNKNNKPDTIFIQNLNNTSVSYVQTGSVNGLYNVTIQLNENIILTEDTYWICIQAVTDVSTENAYGDPDFFTGNMLQIKDDPINTMGYTKNPGSGYFDLPNWSSMKTYWEKLKGVDYEIYNFNFALYGPEKDYDLAIDSIINPKSDAELSTSEDISITIVNNGKFNINEGNYYLRYRINNGLWTENEVGSIISSGTSINYTFVKKADLSIKDTYIIEAEIIFNLDENQNNNSLEVLIENYGVIYPAIADKLVVYETCEGTFTDHGGLEDIQVSYSHDTVVFKPASPDSRIRLEFYDTGMSGYYAFNFYNGSNTEAEHLYEVYSEEMHGLVVEGINPEGAVCVVIPGLPFGQDPYNNFLAKISCVSTKEVDYKVLDLKTSKLNSWEKETIDLTAFIQSRGTIANAQHATFFANGIKLESVSSTIIEYGDIGTARIKWTPEVPGEYDLSVEIPNDNGEYSDDKSFEINRTIYTLGKLVEGFEEDKYPPEGWISKVPAGSNQYIIWYNDRENWEGIYSTNFKEDTLITPLLDIKSGDSLEFIYSAGFFNGTCEIIYATSPNVPWESYTMVDYNLPFAKEITIDLTGIIGVKHIGFVGNSSTLDFVRGPSIHIPNNDLTVTNFEGIIDPLIDDPTNYNITVRNLGKDTLNPNNYKIKLWKSINGEIEEIESLSGVEINFSQYHTFEFTHTFTSVENCKIYASIEFNDDDNLENNISEIIDTYVQKYGTGTIYEGDVSSNNLSYIPFSSMSFNYTESIYHKDSLDFYGEISGIALYYTSAISGEFPYKIFIGETPLNNLDTSFVSTNKMNKVFDGVFKAEVTSNKEKKYYIKFDTPYIYSGKNNLIFAFYRNNENGLSNDILIRTKATPCNQYVTRRAPIQTYQKDTDVSNVEELNSLYNYRHKEQSNILFYVKTTDMDASLSGTIYNEKGEKFENAEVSILGIANKTVTNSEGKYSFPNLPSEKLSINVSAYAYHDSTQQIELTSGADSILNFTLKPHEHIDIEGFILANDSLQPISEVNIIISGYDQEFFVKTDSVGRFEILNIIADINYEFEFNHYKYESLKVNKFISAKELNLGNTILNEIAEPAFNVIAEPTGNGMEITWQLPYSGNKTTFIPYNENDYRSSWNNDANENLQLGNLFQVENTSTITSINLNLYSSSGAESGDVTIKIYNKERKLFLESKPFPMIGATQYDWLTIDVPDFTVSDDYYIMLHWDKVPVVTSSILSYRSSEYNVAYIVNENDEWKYLSEVFGTRYEGAFAITANIIENGNKNSKAITHYDMYRTDLISSQDESKWEKINPMPISGLLNHNNFIDSTYNQTGADGDLLYILKTKYTKDEAPEVYSNILKKGLFKNITISVSSNNYQDITGTTVILNNLNGDSTKVYTDTVINEKVVFNIIPKGDYTLLVKKDVFYNEVSISPISIVNDTSINIELTEIIIDPVITNIETVLQENITVFNWFVGDSSSLNKNQKTPISFSIYLDSLGIPIAEGIISNTFIFNEIDHLKKDSLQKYTAGVQAIYATGISDIITMDFEHSVGEDAKVTIFVTANNGDNMTGTAVNLINMNNDTTYSYKGYVENDSVVFPWVLKGYYSLSVFKDSLFNTNQLDSFEIFDDLKLSIELIELINAPYNLNVNTKQENKESVFSWSSNQTQNKKGGAISYNIFLNDMETPIAEDITDTLFVFTEDNHLNIFGSHEYNAGVQSVYKTGKSIIESIIFNYTVGIDDLTNQNLKLFPNPARDIVTINNTKSGYIEIYNSIGSLVSKRKSFNHKTIINISGFDEGIYLLKFVSSKDYTNRNLIIKR